MIDPQALLIPSPETPSPCTVWPEKRLYWTANAASYALRGAFRSFAERGDRRHNLSAYECRSGGVPLHWHLGHPSDAPLTGTASPGSSTPRVVEPWAPRVGDWVKVNPSPECPSWHSQSREPYPAYGRVESVDRDYADPDRWIETIGEVGDPTYGETEARADATVHVGHDYHVTDAISNPPRVVWIDGMYAAMELEPVPALEAIVRINWARRDLDARCPDHKLRRMLLGAAATPHRGGS